MLTNVKTETKDFKFTLDSFNEEEGTFTGYASVFGVVDAYGDTVQKGAFKKTLKDRKAFPMLWSHSVMEPIGVIRGKEDDKGLAVEGQLNLDVQRARETRSLMKQAKAAGAPMGLSIGFQTVVEEIDKDTKTRRLKEIKLWEISVVVFPACDPAKVDGVKSAAAEEHFDDCYDDGGGWVPNTECPACKAMLATARAVSDALELKPYPNEHACRLVEPSKFEEGSFRRSTRKHEGKEYSVIYGKLKGEDKMTEQAYRYPKDTWDAADAKAHCKDHSGSFEAASDKCLDCGASLEEVEPDGKSTPPEPGEITHSQVIRLLTHTIELQKISTKGNTHG